MVIMRVTHAANYQPTLRHGQLQTLRNRGGLKKNEKPARGSDGRPDFALTPTRLRLTPSGLVKTESPFSLLQVFLIGTGRDSITLARNQHP